MIWKFIKIIFAGIIIGFFAGGLTVNHLVRHTDLMGNLPNDTITLTDTVYIDSIHNMTVIPNVMEFPLDSINIDTISTVVNGQTLKAWYRITLKQ